MKQLIMFRQHEEEEEEKRRQNEGMSVGDECRMVRGRRRGKRLLWKWMK